MEDEYNRLYRNSTLRYSDNHLNDTSNPQLALDVINWRNDIETGDYEPADSAGFYWCTTQMARYADPEHVLERQVSANHIYYRSISFWQASATINLPGARERSDFSGLNGFIERCCVYGSAIAVLQEMNFPDSQGNVTFEKPEENNTRRI